MPAAGAAGDEDAVRWTAYTATIAPRQLTRIVNLLTTGYGFAYLAARAAEKDRSAEIVLTRLRRAEAQLAELYSTLCPAAVPAAEPQRAAREPPPLQWSAFVAQGAHDLSGVTRLLADAVVGARRAADAVQEDEDVEQVCLRLTTALGMLARLLDLAQILALPA
jgi:hypothetical protein